MAVIEPDTIPALAELLTERDLLRVDRLPFFSKRKR